MKRILASIGLVLLANPAWATHASDKVPAIQASMDVNGSITVSSRGYVIGYKLDQPGKLPAYVVQLLNRAIPTWRFQPNVHDGHPVNVKANMDIRLVARQLPNKKYSISIDQTTFGTHNEKDDNSVREKGKRTPPRYPRELVRNHVNGTVFVRARIDRQGRVSKAAVEQVNLGTRGVPNLLKRWRREFTKSALTAVRTWHFRIPTQGQLASAEHWDVVIPISYRVGTPNSDRYAYGQWHAYIPGPPQYIPWATRSRLAEHAKPPAGHDLHVVGTGLHRIDHPKS